MMLKLFDVQDKKLVPNEVTYWIPELRAVMDNFPDEYLKVLWYIFATTCPDGTNPYVNMDEERKEDVILADLKPFSFYLDDMSIEKAKAKCRALYETPTLRIASGAKKMLDKIAVFLDEAEITAGGKEGNATEIRGMMKEFPQYIENYTRAEAILKEEQAKVRGGAKLRYDQRPNYNDSKADQLEPNE